MSCFLRLQSRGAPAAVRCFRSRQASSIGRGGEGADHYCDVAIVGGGVVGSSVALHLAAMEQQRRIVVLERDATYTLASAPRSAGGIRQQFSLPVNVETSIYGVQFLKSTLRELCAGTDVDTDVQFRENGYLVLASPGGGEAALRENVAVQHASGATWIRLLEPEALSAQFPWLSTEGVALGAFGEQNEGYFDPWALLQALRKGAMARGVVYMEQGVTGINLGPGGSIRALQLRDGKELEAGIVVNAAGAFGGRLVAMCGPGVTPLPVVPRKRSMWLFNARAEGNAQTPPDDTPLTVDASGVYFRSEGSAGRFVCGAAPLPEDDKDAQGSPEDLEQADHELFEERVWPAMAARVPAFEALRVEASWAGFYEFNTLDQNGVVGWHPDVPNLLVACGFSGHGLQQAPGVGRACAELLVHGGYRTIDFSCLGYDRIVRGEPLLERACY